MEIKERIERKDLQIQGYGIRKLLPMSYNKLEYYKGGQIKGCCDEDKEIEFFYLTQNNLYNSTS